MLRRMLWLLNVHDDIVALPMVAWNVREILAVAEEESWGEAASCADACAQEDAGMACILSRREDAARGGAPVNFSASS